MIVEVHRPETIEDALRLLAQTQPRAIPLGGGTNLSRIAARLSEAVALVDTRRLPIHEIRQEGQLLKVGAGVTLQELMDCPAIPAALREALAIEAGLNIRNAATIAGAILACDGRSAFITALLALDPRLVWAQAAAGDETQTSLGDTLALREIEAPAPRLMTAVHFGLNATLAFQSVARSPLDRPVICAAVAGWPSGRTRLALGGWGKAPIVAMDGPEPGGIGMAARSAGRSAGDAWATAEYRASAAASLAVRLAAQPGKVEA